MAKIYIAEFSSMGVASNGQPQIPAMPPLAEQVVAIGAEADSAAFSTQTKYVWLSTDAICSIKIGTGDPTATMNNMRLAADKDVFLGVQPGDKISVIANT